MRGLTAHERADLRIPAGQYLISKEVCESLVKRGLMRRWANQNGGTTYEANELGRLALRVCPPEET